MAQCATTTTTTSSDAPVACFQNYDATGTSCSASPTSAFWYSCATCATSTAFGRRYASAFFFGGLE